MNLPLAAIAEAIPDRVLIETPDDPVWKAARARFGKLACLLRIVDRAAGTDEIIALPAMKDFGELMLDGCVLVKPDGRLLQPDTPPTPR